MDFLAAVNAVHTRSDDAKPEELMTAVRTRKITTKAASAITASGNAQSSQLTQKPTTPGEALRVLRLQPDSDTLTEILRQISFGDFDESFTLHAPGHVQSQITNVLLNSIVPAFWSTWSKAEKKILISTLSTGNGVSALVAKIGLVVNNGKQDQKLALLRDLVDLASHLFRGDDFVSRLWNGLDGGMERVKKDIAWKDLVNLLGSGKIISIIAQAGDALISDTSQTTAKSVWLSQGQEYGVWLGRNVAQLSTEGSADDSPRPEVAKTAALLLSKALSLGYSISLVKGLFGSLVDRKHNQLHVLITHMPAYAQRTFLEQTLRWLSALAPDETSRTRVLMFSETGTVSAIAAAITLIAINSNSVQQTLLSILSDPNSLSSTSIPVHRACLAVLSTSNSDDFTTIFEKLSSTFGDPLFINHAPLLQQESLAQTLLLTAGYLHRSSPMAVLMTARSSGHMQGISNRLDSSNQRARWLGMVVGTAVSSLVDKAGGTKLSFGTDDMDTEDAKWHLGLVQVQDTAGTLEDFRKFLLAPAKSKNPRHGPPIKVEKMPVMNGKPVFGPLPPPQPVQTSVIGEKVSEIPNFSDEEGEDDDLKPYSKPDSDPEDSDEDATLVNRSKPRAPVYIRDLMRLLRDDKEPARFQLGIKHAAPLIRRKMKFGSEVTDHAEELLSMFSNLQDPFSTTEFDELRLQAMIALFISDPSTLGPWLSRRAFAGEFSIAQRCMMLSTLGLGGKELAGFSSEDSALIPIPSSNSSFPSKALPPHLHALYSGTPASNRTATHLTRIDFASAALESSLVAPLALRAADQSTADLNAVKIRTFSSRMETQRTKRKPAPNALVQILGPAIFHPLLSRVQQEFSAYGSSSTIWGSSSILLSTLIKTLAILLHASGPVTAELDEISRAFWSFLLSLRVLTAGDMAILSAVLFGLLTLLEVNSTTEGAKQRLGERFGWELEETQLWVNVVFERIGGGGDGRRFVDERNHCNEEAKLRALAAGVLVRIGEVSEGVRRRVFGGVPE